MVRRQIEPPRQNVGTPAPLSEARPPDACCADFFACASVSKTATPTVTATPALLYVARMTWSQPLFMRIEPSAPCVVAAQFVVRCVAPLAYTRSPIVSFFPG